jgi:tetratricopeptide (TPR) repeat protein
LPRPRTHLGASRALVPLATFLLVAVATPADSGEESLYSAYLTLVERFCLEKDEALRALSRWSPAALDEVGQRLHECETRQEPRAARSPPKSGETGCGEEPPPWAAAAALHTLGALESWPGPSDLSHLSFAARLQEQVGDDVFRRHWYLAAGLGSLYRTDLGPARSYLEKGVEQFENDPALLVALGVTYEVEGWRRELTIRAFVTERSHTTSERRRFSVQRDRCGREAAALYEKALSRDPTHAEARLRLGRVELLLGRTDRGISRLRWVTEHARDPDLVYLAHLFIGRAQKGSGQLDAALASYRAALQIVPYGQAAYVATSQALYLSGSPAAAAEVLERGFARRRRSPERDSWWRYPETRLGQVPELLSQLREEACR